MRPSWCSRDLEREGEVRLELTDKVHLAGPGSVWPSWRPSLSGVSWAPAPPASQTGAGWPAARGSTAGWPAGLSRSWSSWWTCSDQDMRGISPGTRLWTKSCRLPPKYQWRHLSLKVYKLYYIRLRVSECVWFVEGNLKYNYSRGQAS